MEVMHSWEIKADVVNKPLHEPMILFQLLDLYQFSHFVPRLIHCPWGAVITLSEVQFSKIISQIGVESSSNEISLK